VDKSPSEDLLSPKKLAAARLHDVFTVSVLPLRYEAEDRSQRAAAAEVYEVFLRLLRSIPNLVLVDSDTPADFSVTVTGIAPDPNRKGLPGPAPAGPNAAIMARIMSPAGQYHLQVRVYAQEVREMAYQTLILGPLPDLCQPVNGKTPYLCVTPESRVKAAIEELRLHAFPPDFSLHREYLAQFRNMSLSSMERSMALNKLNSLSRLARSGFWEKDWQPADLAAALEMAKASPSDPTDDGRLGGLLLYSMNNVKNPDFVRPLIHILQQESGEEVRMEAARILANNFSGHSLARSALEAASRTDTSEFVRQIAQRSLLGEKAWRADIIATLNDSRLSAVERVTPLVLGEQTSFGGPASIVQWPPTSELGMDLVPDEHMITGVVSIFPTLMADPKWLEVSGSVMRILESSNHPTVKDAMLQALRDERDPSVAATAASYLLRKHGDSLEVRGQVEESAGKTGLVREILDEHKRVR
jgi:hypothetical protein